LAAAFNAMTRSLAQADRERAEREQLRANYIRRVITAQEDERKRIARELHDSTSQALTSLLVGLRHLEEATDPDTAHQRIGEIRKTVNATLDEVHALAWQLRPSVLDDLGLAAALQRYIADYQTRYGIQVDYAARNLAERLPVEVETTLYRVIQEGLTNIARHARAHNASILIEQRAASVRVIVEDNGVGFDVEQVGGKRLGLQGIHERVQLLGGKLVIESQPGQGTSLFIEIPLTEPKATNHE
jgi:signal transduction histidine kinase